MTHRSHGCNVSLMRRIAFCSCPLSFCLVLFYNSVSLYCCLVSLCFVSFIVLFLFFFFLFPVTKPCHSETRKSSCRTSSAEVEVAEKAACRKTATVFRVEKPVNNVSFKTFVNPS